jgi:hypothetical protein
MIQLILRQYRSLILTTLVAVVVLELVLLWHGLKTADLTTAATAAGCPTGPRCSEVNFQVLDRYKQLGLPLEFFVVVPVLIGAFWGAPLLAREFEQHTACVAWTQSISRRRWLATRWLVLGAIVTACGAAAGVGVTWWSERYRNLLTLTGGHPQALLAQSRGLGPPIWWLSAFLVGAACGVLARRTLPAMALAGGLLLALTIGMSITPNAVHASLTGWGTELAAAQAVDAGVLLGLAAIAVAACLWLIDRAAV